MFVCIGLMALALAFYPYYIHYKQVSSSVALLDILQSVGNTD